MSTGDRALTAILTRDRLIVGLALAALTSLAWWYTLTLSAHMETASMPDMPGMDMSSMAATTLAPWTLKHALFVFAMWSVMMIGMMTPSLAPMVLIYTQVARQASS